MATNEVKLYLAIEESGADPEQLDRVTHRVMQDLRTLGVDSVEPIAGEEVPEGAKSPTAFTWGALALVAAPTLLPRLIEFLEALALRGEKRTVRIKTPAGLEVEFTPETPLSEDELVALVEKLSQAEVK